MTASGALAATALAGRAAASVAGRRRSGRRAAVGLRATAAAVPEIWKAGPAEMRSGSGQKLVWLMKENPLLVDDALEQELNRLGEEQREAAEAEQRAAGKPKTDALVLRQRANEVRAKDRCLAVSELMYLMVCRELQKVGAPPVKPMRDGGWVSLGALFNLKSLTSDIYSVDALELVKEHLFKAVISQGKPGEPIEINSAVYGMQLAQVGLFTCAQIYAMSVLFGYFLRRMERRFSLEKMMSSMSLPEFGESESKRTLKDYIKSFDPTQLQQEGVLTREAQLATEAQVAALFGDLKKLQAQLVDFVGPPDPLMSSDDVTKKIENAIQMGHIPSVKISMADLRRLVLEAVAFGALLKDSEGDVEAAAYELSVGKVMQQLEGFGSE